MSLIVAFGQTDTISYETPKCKWQVALKASVFHALSGIYRLEPELRFRFNHSFLISPFYMNRKLGKTTDKFDNNYIEGLGCEVSYRFFYMLDKTSNTHIYVGLAYQYRHAVIHYHDPERFVQQYDAELGFTKVVVETERLNEAVYTHAYSFQLGIETPVYKSIIVEFFGGIGHRNTRSYQAEFASSKYFKPDSVYVPTYSGVDLRAGIRVGLLLYKSHKTIQ